MAFLSLKNHRPSDHSIRGRCHYTALSYFLRSTRRVPYSSSLSRPIASVGWCSVFPMAFSATIRCPSLYRLPEKATTVSQSPSTISFRSYPAVLSRRKPFSLRSASVEAPTASGGIAPAIAVSDNALKHFNKMRSERSEDLCLRIGVKQGGCSGLSYTMEFESRDNARPDDSFIEYNGFAIVCDPKSLLFLYGMQLDYSDALIGGGFSFKNPNATQTCGCGKSFAAEM